MFRLARSRFVFTTTVASLSLAIAITVVAYSIADAFAGGANVPSDRVILTRSSFQRFATTAPAFTDDQEAALAVDDRVFQHVSGVADYTKALAWNSSSELVRVEAVDGGYFGLMGVGAQRGRVLLPYDDAPSALPALVLSDAVWQSIGATTDTIGSEARLGGVTFEIVGVAQPGFEGLGFVGTRAVWVCRSSARRFAPGPTALPGPAPRQRVGAGLRSVKPAVSRPIELPSLRVIAQLAPGVSIVRAGDDPVLQHLGDTSGDVAGSHLSKVVVLSLRHAIVSPVQSLLQVGILCLPLLVFGVACTNIANLRLSDAVATINDVAVMSALGASRSRLILRHLIDSLALVAISSAASFPLALLFMSAASGALRQPLAVLAPTVITDWHLGRQLWLDLIDLEAIS